MTLTSEQAIEKLGGFGWFQLRLILLVGYVYVFTSMVLMVMIFSTAEPPWRCTANSTSCTLNGTYKVGDTNYDHRCSIPRSDWEFAVEGDFDSIITEWDLVCSTAIHASLANSLLFIVWIIGAMVASILSDKFGRKIVILPFAIFACASAFLSGFSQAYWVFALFRTLVGLGLGGFVIVVYVYIMEFMNKRSRGPVGILFFLTWIAAMCLLALLGYLVQSWRKLTFITSVPGFLFILLWFFLPESVRWLLVKGKIKEAKKTLISAGKINNISISEDELSLLGAGVNEGENGKQKLGDIRCLFASRSLIHLTLVSCYCWFASALMYYGISLSTPTVGGNMYLNFFISTICEAISLFIAVPSLKYIGRQKTMSFSMWLAGVVGVAAALLTYYDNGSDGFLAGKILMTMVLGKFFIAIAFVTVYLYSSELFPTVVRNTAMGISTSAARIGSASSPYIVFSQRIHPLMPFGIMAINAIICGILCLTLPETTGKSLPDTVGQVDETQSSSYGREEEGDEANHDEKSKLASPIMLETAT